MKRYLCVAIVSAFVAANASGNPFDLSVNLKKIDQDQDVLLFQLTNMAEAKKKREKKTEEKNIKQVEKTKADTRISTSEKDEIHANGALRVQTRVTEVERIKKIKEEQVKIEEQRAKKEKVRKAKHKNEKLSKEKQKTAKSKMADINITREETEAAKEADKAYREAVKQVDEEH